MCFHYSMSQVAQNLENRYNAPFPAASVYKPAHHVSGFTYPHMPVVTAAPEYEIRLFRWGLIPSWTTNPEQADKIRSMTLNARSDTVFEKPSFRKPIQSRRCLVPADGFFEWQQVGNQKIPWFIRSRNTEIFSFGGIWDKWLSGDGEPWFTFSILTTDANPLMAEIHNTKKRMPLILSAENEAKWLDISATPAEIKAIMTPITDSALESWTISRLITTRGADTNTPEVKKPFAWDLPEPPRAKF